MRKDSREAVFVLLYRDCFCEEFDEKFKAKIYKDHNLNEVDAQFADSLYSKVKENEEYLLNIISDSLYSSPSTLFVETGFDVCFHLL